MTLIEFTEFLKQHCAGDWWDKIDLPIKPNPTHGDCEACGVHPLTEKHTAILNDILTLIKTAGGPAPTCFYTHCWEELFIEWTSENNENSIVVDINNKWGADALVRVPPRETYFIKIDDPVIASKLNSAHERTKDGT